MTDSTDGPPFADESGSDAARRGLLLGGVAGAGLLGLAGLGREAMAQAAGPGAMPALVVSTRALLEEGAAGTADTVLTLGHTRAGDGGGALFRRLEAAYDAFDDRAADGSRWRMLPVAGTVNVRQFGATGDESRDDTDAIRRAAAFLRRSDASVLYFPAGTYRVSGPILQFGPGDKRFSIRGADADTTWILLGGPLEAPLVSIEGGPGPARAEWISFHELSFVNRNRRFPGDAVRIRFAYHIDWIRCRWIDFDGRALELDNYWDSNFEGCRVIGCGVPEASDAGAARRRGGAGRSAVWIGCTEECDSANNLNFTACQFESSWHHQVEIDYFARRIHFLSCKFHGRQDVTIAPAQLLIRGARGGKIMGCAFAYGQEHDHIAFADPGEGRLARGWSITASDFSYAAGAAVRIRAASHMVVAHNNFGAIGQNGASIVIEDAARRDGSDGQIVIAPNTYAAGEALPRIADAAQTAPAASDGLRAAGGWQEGHLQLGRHHLWVDAEGRLRLKEGAPESDTDGRAL